jgi:hypothetical protein
MAAESAAFFTGELFPAVFPPHAERVAVAAIAPPIIASLIATDPKFLATLPDPDQNSGWLELE